MPPDTNRAGVEGRSVLAANIGWILAITLAVLMGALAVSWQQTPMYVSSVRVVIEPVLERGGPTPQQPDMGTEKEIATSGAVTQLAASELRITSPELLSGLAVSVPVDTHVLKISYRSSDASTAQRRASAAAAAYVSYRNDAAGGDSRDVGAAGPAVHASVITPATLPSHPSRTSTIAIVIAGLVLGASLGIGTAIVRDTLSGRLRDRWDLERATGAPVLAAVPAFRRRGVTPAGRVVVLRQPESAAAEAYRYLRTKVMRLNKEEGVRTILVTSSREGEGKTTTAANLAAAVAATGARVTLVCTDIRRPQVHRLFGLDNAVGLTSVLADRVTLRDAIRVVGLSTLRVVCSGPASSTSSLAGPRIASVIQALADDSDLVVIDSAPVLTVADTVAMVAIADAVLLVADAKRSTRQRVADAVTEVEQVGSSVTGTVLNNVRRGRRRQFAVYRERQYSSALSEDRAGASGERRRIRPAAQL